MRRRPAVPGGDAEAHRALSRGAITITRLSTRGAARAAAVEHFLTISHRVKQEMIATFGIPEQRISVTSLGVDQAYRPLSHEQAQGVLGRLGIQ